MSTLKRSVHWSVFTCLPLLIAAGGCERNPDPSPAAVQEVQAPLSIVGARILGFEQLSDWSTNAGILSASTTRIEGNFSLGIRNITNATLTSAQIDSLVTVGDTATIDINMPSSLGGLTALGALQLFVEIPSRGVFNQFVGQRELSGLPLNRFNRLSFAIPTAIRTHLQATYTDLRVRVVFSGVPTTTGTWLLDRLSFDVQPPNSPTPSIEQRLVALEGQVTTLQTNVTSLQTAVTNLQTANTALTTRVGTLETGLAASNGRITTLEGQNATLTASVNTLNGRVATLETQTSANTSSIAALASQLSAFQAITNARLDALEAGGSGDLTPAQVAQLQAILQHLSFQTVATFPSLVVTGANVHVRNGKNRTICGGTDVNACNGVGNLLIGYNEEDTINPPAVRTGSHNLIVGQGHGWTSYGGLVAGFENRINGAASSVTGGRNNIATGFVSSVTGGSRNEAFNNVSHVSGGADNTAFGLQSVVVGGTFNQTRGIASIIVGGTLNDADGERGIVVGGSSNFASSIGPGSVVVGGNSNTASSGEVTILGGRNNIADGPHASVSGGTSNRASGVASSISGGANRTAVDLDDWVAGALFQDF